MKTKINIKRSIKALCRLWFLLPALFLSSCIQPTIFSVQFPQKGATYIGNELVDFVIKYSKTVPRADVYLNGVSISDEFVYGSTSATASILNVKKYLKQGTNTLTVDPLAFGPTVSFVVDNAGPEILVTWGKTNSGTGTVDVGGTLRDVSGISSLVMKVIKVNSIDPTTGIVQRTTQSTWVIPVTAAATFFKTGVDISTGVSIYNFTAIDVHGQVTTKEYLADSNEINAMSISNAMRIAVGDSFVESLRPIIASQLYTTLQKAPIDIRNTCWNDTNKDDPVSQNPNGGFCTSGTSGLLPVSSNTTQDGGTFNAGLNPVYATLLGIPMTINVKRVNMTAGNSTALLNKFKVQANNYLKIDMVITQMLVSLRIDMKILFFNLSIDPMTMTIGRIVVDTGAVVSAQSKKFHVELTDSNFSLQDISVSETTLGGINLGGLVDIIMPLIEGLIGGMLPGIMNPILNDNLEKIVIGACMYPKNDIGPNVACNAPTSTAKFNWAVNVETLKTDNLFGAGSPYDMIIGLETMFNLLKVDALARPSLGPIYVEDPVNVGLIYNSLGEAGTNLTVAVSSNAINQAFSALYASGMSHFALVNGVTTYGADPAKPVGTDGQTRIRLYPESPPYFTLNPVGGGVGGAAAARIGYESAVMHLDLNENGVWKEQLRLGVDFSIAASISQVDNAVRLGIDGSPTFNLRTMVNNTGLPVTQGMLQGVLDLVTMYFLPSITDQFIIIDLAKLADTSLNGTQVLYQSDADTLKTQSLTAGGCPITGTTSGSDGKYDYVCETINFVVNTNTLTTTGNKGTNLMFQMEARDPDIPAAPAIPRLDLDGDGMLDYKDNCAAPILMQVAAIKIEGGLVPANIDTNGDPVGTFVDRIKGHINRWVAKEKGVLTGTTSGDYTEYLKLTNDAIDDATQVAAITAAKGSGTPATPGVTDIAWWNTMRKGDAAINSLGSYPWINMIYSNANQNNTDGDRFGELCEDDADRDTIYSDNGAPTDVCPSVKDSTNDSGACTIDTAGFVMLKNKQNGKCITHLLFNGTGDPGGAVNFTPGSSTAGSQLQFATCDTASLAQRFYIEISPTDEGHVPRDICTGGTACTVKERIIYIYTNEYKQTAPGFYDTTNMHYVASTLGNLAATMNGCNSSYWAYDDVITTTMCGYDATWREWVLSLSGDTNYPFMIESWRSYMTYGERTCLFEKSAGGNVDLDRNVETAGGSCFPSTPTDYSAGRGKASFQVLLNGTVPWAGLFSVN